MTQTCSEGGDFTETLCEVLGPFEVSSSPEVNNLLGAKKRKTMAHKADHERQVAVIANKAEVYADWSSSFKHATDVTCQLNRN